MQPAPAEDFAGAPRLRAPAKSGTLPPVVRDIVLHQMKLAETTCRLVSPFSKDETGHES